MTETRFSSQLLLTEVVLGITCGTLSINDKGHDFLKKNLLQKTKFFMILCLNFEQILKQRRQEY